MVLPELLRDARGHLSDANVAASHVAAAYQSDQLHLVRQYISEWQHAVDMCSQVIEDHWLSVDINELTEQEQAMRNAAKAYTAAMNDARGGDGPW